MTSTRTVGTVIRDRRKALGLTQPQLEAETEVSQSTISALENDAYPLERVGFGNVMRIAQALGWTPTQFLAEIGMDGEAFESPLAEPTPALTRTFRDAIRLYGDIHPELKDPEWQSRLLNLEFRDRQVTSARDWLKLLLDVQGILADVESADKS